ncbi:Putative CDP-diacylglycerol--glycerol-3-phosphate 3-phosphatidyl-transferase 2 [Corynebacterium choanae]|uniref:CDP-diacylglycerol--glycerol-3-phosphate 3-phosphatidyl-transferase 2 n=2 Tax=Corynebacterium choanae TaxID=1862358 RepID=A0A3G6J7P2_9CORY|nr:Putative CDP-diacylglycerol--glycerol-3-phosphate 3-phosphatidyl-transferase 2 [Corynebacterium choanae]
MIPLFAWLVLRGDGIYTSWMWWATAVFALLMFTDKLDGDIARKRGLITDFGKIADPIADKALMITALVCLNLTGQLWVIATVLIVVRELGITLWRMLQLRQGNVVPASRGGKVKTVLQTVAVGLYLIPIPQWMVWVQALVMTAAIVVTLLTGVQYLLAARQLRDGARRRRR